MLTLAITGFTADPDRVTEILGIEPSGVGRKGIVSLPSNRPNTFNGWWWEARSEQLFGGLDHDQGLGSILDLIRDREPQFARLRQEVQPDQVGIYGGLYLHPDEQCGIWLEVAQMRVLVDCEIEWGLDLFTAS